MNSLSARDSRSRIVSAIAASKPAQISALSAGPSDPSSSTVSSDRGLEAREGEIASLAALERAREVKSLGVAFVRQRLDLRSARIGQTQELGRLVEGLAKRIVDGRADPAIAPDPFDDLQLGVSARYQEEQIGEIERRQEPAASAHALRDG